MAKPRDTNVDSTAYPTDGRERQKKKEKTDKEQGIEKVVKKKDKIVEDHYDDCGDCLDSIVTNLDAEESHFAFDQPDDWNYDAHETSLIDNMQFQYFYGQPGGHHRNLVNVTVSNMEEFFKVLVEKPGTVDIAEICGGEARTMQLATRRRLTTGKNFDIVAGCDLTRANDRHYAIQYFERFSVLCAVMAPVCSPYGPLGALVKNNYPESWKESMRTAMPIAKFCGNIALIQLRKGKSFIQEQPYPSTLYEETPWPQVLRHDRVAQVVYDRCQCGLKADCGPNKGLAIKKPSSMTGSDSELLDPFRGLRCQHRHQHAPTKGSGKMLSNAQVWTWQEADRIIWGITNLKKRIEQQRHKAYPINFEVKHATPGTPERKPDSRACDPTVSTCPGCKGRRKRNDFTHNRVIGQCMYPHDEPFIPTCEACIQHKRHTDPAHTKDAGCNAETTRPRVSVARERQLREPAEPVRSVSSASDARAAPGGRELGADAEAEHAPAADEDTPEDVGGSRMAKAASSGSASSAAPAAPTTAMPKRPSSSHARAAQPVGPATRTWEQARPTGTTGPADDWTRFDIQKSLRALRYGTDDQQREILRKLHVRWWHAPAAAMHNLLDKAGVPAAALNKIPGCVQTCKVCRNWNKPKPSNVTTYDLPDKFNERVEMDLMFVYDKVVATFVDCATRWCHTVIIKDKKEQSMLEALDSWCAIHGPMKKLVTDSESAIYRDRVTQEALKRRGIQHIPRARGQQIGTVDRRIALLRDAIHKVVDQLKVEMTTESFRHVISDTTFASNCLLSINGMTPYMAVYGRVPCMLPPIDIPDANNENALPGTIRYTMRIREIAIETMVRCTAKARADRALSTRTVSAGQSQGYKIGDLVDFHTMPGNKDTGGWHGPATVVDASHPGNGTITLRHLNHAFERRFQDVRPHLTFTVFLAASQSALGVYTRGLQKIRQIAENLNKGQCLHLGKVLQNGVWTKTKQNSIHTDVYSTAKHIAEQSLGRKHIVAVRIAFGCAKLGALPNYNEALTLWWTSPNDITNEITYDNCNNEIPAINFQQLVPDKWTYTRAIQFLSANINSYR